MNVINSYRNVSWQSKIHSWLDISVVGSIATEPSTTNVTSWTDKINGNVWTIANIGTAGGANNPKWDGTNYSTGNSPGNNASDGLIFPNSANDVVEVLMVLKRYNGTVFNCILGAYGGFDFVITPDQSIGGAMLDFSLKGSTGEFFKNSKEVNEKRFLHFSFANTTAFTSFVLGCRGNAIFGAGCYLYDVIFFNSTVSPQERVSLYNYMYDKHPDITN